LIQLGINCGQQAWRLEHVEMAVVLAVKVAALHRPLFLAMLIPFL
jgi:hypothetical protein